MSYQHPSNINVDFSWVGAPGYTLPSPTSSNFQWGVFGCNYEAEKPFSPHINFVLDKINDYAGPLGSDISFSFSESNYSFANPVKFSYPEPYIPPTSPNIEFRVVCDIKIDPVLVVGDTTLDTSYFTSELVHWDTPWEVSGSALLSGVEYDSSDVNFYIKRQIGQSFTWDYPLDISWQGGLDYIPPPSSQGIYTWSSTLEGIAGTSEIAVSVIAQSEVTLSIAIDSTIDRGVYTKSNARIKSLITSVGLAELTPIIHPAENLIGSNLITSDSGPITVCVQEVKNLMEFSDGISFVKGRIIFGYPEATIIRQVYEMSNNRSLVIPNVPENPSYAVFLNTTDFDLTDTELKRGTVDMSFSFAHDVTDIKQINVWISTPGGLTYLDKMTIIDYQGGNQKNHILYEPGKLTTQLSIPIHCISKKENQFYIEIEYKNTAVELVETRPRYFNASEKYVIPFQAHFDNRNPYLNIADHDRNDGPAGSPHIYSLLYTRVEVETKFLTPPDDSNFIQGPGGGGDHIYYSTASEFYTRKYLVPADDVNYIQGPGGGGEHFFFAFEFVDQSTIQIGG